MNVVCFVALPTCPVTVSVVVPTIDWYSTGVSMPRLATLPAAPFAPSFAPMPTRSMPRPVFERIALPRIEMPWAVDATRTPMPLEAIVFASPAPVPPIVLALVDSAAMPAVTFACAVVPLAAVPIRLPRTTCPLPEYSHTPWRPFAPITLSVIVTAPVVPLHTITPSPLLPSAVLPATSRPMWLPVTVTAALPLAFISTP